MKKLIIMAQIHFILILTCLMFLGSSSALGQEPISQRYEFNTNNWRGYIDINVDGNSLSGGVVLHTDPDGRSVKKRFSFDSPEVERFGSHSLKIKFQRSRSNQVYYGWFSKDRRMIAGYFERGNEKYPWYAIRYLKRKK